MSTKIYPIVEYKCAKTFIQNLIEKRLYDYYSYLLQNQMPPLFYLFKIPKIPIRNSNNFRHFCFRPRITITDEPRVTGPVFDLPINYSCSYMSHMYVIRKSFGILDDYDDCKVRDGNM